MDEDNVAYRQNQVPNKTKRKLDELQAGWLSWLAPTRFARKVLVFSQQSLFGLSALLLAHWLKPLWIPYWGALLLIVGLLIALVLWYWDRMSDGNPVFVALRSLPFLIAIGLTLL